MVSSEEKHWKESVGRKSSCQGLICYKLLFPCWLKRTNSKGTERPHFFWSYLYTAETWNTSSNPRPSVGILGKVLSIVALVHFSFLDLKNLPVMQGTPVQFLGWEDPLEKGYSTTPVFSGFPVGSAGKESTCNVGHLGLIPGLGRFPGEGKGYPLQYYGLENSMDCIVRGVIKSWTLENPMDGGAWWAAVHGVAKSQTWLSDFTLTFHFYKLEKEMATHSSVLAWRIPGKG